MKIPFIFTKNGLFSYGKGREINKILYYESPSIERDIKILDLEYDSESMKTLPKYKLKLLDIKKKYNVLSDYEYEKSIIELNTDNLSTQDKELRLLGNELKYNKIERLEYEKRKADILQKPWAVTHMSYDDVNDPMNMSMEFDYNDYFIKKLQDLGFSGNSEEDIIESWISQVFASNIEATDFNLVDEDSSFVKTKKVDKISVIG